MSGEREMIREALDACFSYLDERPSLETRIMNRLNEGAAPRSTLRFVLMPALVLVLAFSVAYAEYCWKIFSAMPFEVGSNPANAAKVMQRDVHTQRLTDEVQVVVEEAGYDGRTLYLSYTYVADGDDTVYTEETVYDMLEKYGVGWWTDNMWINGECVGMAANSSGMLIPTGEPGKVTQTEYWCLNHEGVFLDGVAEIALPIGEKQKIPTYRQDPSYYDADGDMLLPKAGVMTFKLDTRDIQDEVVTEHPHIQMENDTMTASITEACFTPLKTYITLEYAVKEEAFAAFIAEHGEYMPDTGGTYRYRYSPVDVIDGWLNRLTLVDGDGTPLFPDWFAMECYGDHGAEYSYPSIEHMPDELYMAPVVDGAADMAQAVRIR